MFYYLGLEPYPDRYTYQLTEWARKALVAWGGDFKIVAGQQLATTISVGVVLDAFGRTHYSTTQLAELIKMLRENGTSSDDVIFFEDMFTPGIESLGYIFDQLPRGKKPRVFVRCLAQSIDPDDFVCYTGMSRWMRNYENMVCGFVDAVLCSSEEMVAHAKISWNLGSVALYNISGLTFDAEEVRSYTPTKSFFGRPRVVSFSSRWDAEKQPDFYAAVIRRVKEIAPETEFRLLQGGPLKSNDPSYVDLANTLSSQGLLTLRCNLTKKEYYENLATTRVLFNCALQDWVSNTASEADALGCNLVYPAYRSFPEIFDNDPARLYVPWSVDDAVEKVLRALEAPQENVGELSKHTSATMERILSIIYGDPLELNRNSVTYRKWASTGRRKQ